MPGPCWPGWGLLPPGGDRGLEYVVVEGWAGLCPSCATLVDEHLASVHRTEMEACVECHRSTSPHRRRHADLPPEGAATASVGRSQWRSQAKVNSAMGSVVGAAEPPSGSTVMPAPVAVAASPSRTTVWSLLGGMRPAGAMVPAVVCSHSW